jgi:hypothetical protein
MSDVLKEMVLFANEMKSSEELKVGLTDETAVEASGTYPSGVFGVVGFVTLL